MFPHTNVNNTLISDTAEVEVADTNIRVIETFLTNRFIHRFIHRKYIYVTSEILSKLADSFPPFSKDNLLHHPGVWPSCHTKDTYFVWGVNNWLLF